jgi:cytoskeletal protein CcmA (bactofilin family)
MPKKEEKRRRLEDKIGPIESVIASNTKFKGKINAQDNVLISGKFSGDIQCEQLVKIDSGGKVKGTVSSTYIIIEGELKGDIQSAEHVEIRQGGRVIGNINTAEIAIAEGSFIQGNQDAGQRIQTSKLCREEGQRRARRHPRRTTGRETRRTRRLG